MNNPSLRTILFPILAALLLALPRTDVLGEMPPPALHGVYTIQHQSNNRFLDAWVTADKDFAVVTRKDQDNLTQRWILTSVGGNTYTIQQQHTARFLDAHEYQGKDFRVVTRMAQPKSLTQRWIVTALGDNSYTIHQQSNGRLLDAYRTEGNDFAVVTRTPQPNMTQIWIIKRPS